MARKNDADESYTATPTESEETKKGKGSKSTRSDKQKDKKQSPPVISKGPNKQPASPKEKISPEITKNRSEVKSAPKQIVQLPEPKKATPDKKVQIKVPKKSPAVTQTQPKKTFAVLKSAKSLRSITSVKSTRSKQPSSEETGKNVSRSKQPSSEETAGKNVYVKMTAHKTAGPAQTPYITICQKSTTPLGGSVIEDAEPKARPPKFRKYEQDGGSWSTGFRLTVAGLTLLAIVLIVFFAFLIHNHLSHTTVDLDLPDLTELCQRIQQGSRSETDLHCFYHANKYPINCSYSPCSSVMLKVHVEKTKLSIIRTSYSLLPASEFDHLNDIPDYTPCANYSWCSAGKCVSTPNSKVKKFTELSVKENGNWELHCGLECVSYSQDDNLDDIFAAHEELERSKLCAKRIMCDSPKRTLFEPAVYAQFGINTCTNPMPLYGGSVCWRNDTQNVNPLQIVKICGDCDHPFLDPTCNFIVDNYDHSCIVNCSGTRYVLPNGSKCSRGYCFQGYCTPVTNQTNACISRT